jgi:hypothetical protein
VKGLGLQQQQQRPLSFSFVWLSVTRPSPGRRS